MQSPRGIKRSADDEPPSAFPKAPGISGANIPDDVDEEDIGDATILTYTDQQLFQKEALRVASGHFPEDYIRVEVHTPKEEAVPEEYKGVAALVQEAMALRDKYIFRADLRNYADKEPCATAPFDPFSLDVPPAVDYVHRMVDGVVTVFPKLADGSAGAEPAFPLHSLNEFYRDLEVLLRIASSGPVKSFCFWRLQTLQARFNLHTLLNAPGETLAQKKAPHRDFYNIRKVDTHIHHSSSMNQKHLLRFIKKKLKEEGQEVVIYRDGKHLTLEEVFTSLGLTAYDLSVDKLDVHADKHTFHRFDKFNLKYNPIGESRLREIFLKYNNLIKGRYLAEITRELFDDFQSNKYQNAEYRISIYGSNKEEWKSLADWVIDHKIYSDNVRWLIQVPRLYEIYKSKGIIENFQDMLDNIFEPLFAVSIDPSVNPKLHAMLQQVVGFDCVDDESKTEKRVHKRFPPPAEWAYKHNPPYSYYQYYMWANITSLNKLRASRGLHTLAYRPHAGEAGDVDHLAAVFLAAHSINHGIQLRKSPALQYLFYLKQVGLALSPLSNNSLFLDYNKCPLPDYLARGLNVSISTDDPLQFHYTKEPLIEEYTIAKQVFKLSPTDVCELARNSVLQSGFEHPVKRFWLGKDFDDVNGNDIDRTNVPDIRIRFRQETLQGELDHLERAAPSATERTRQILLDIKPPLKKSKPNPPGEAAPAAPANGTTPAPST